MSFDFELDTLQLLAEDPILKKYKSNKDGARRVKRLGDVLTIVVVAGMLGVCCMLWMKWFMCSLVRYYE